MESIQKKKLTAEELVLIEQKNKRPLPGKNRNRRFRNYSKTQNYILKSGRLIEPPGQNALEYYQKILNIAPDNNEAKAGIDRIFDFYLDSVQVLMEKQEFARVESLLQRAEVVKPGSVKLRLARVHLTDAKKCS